MKKNDLKGSVFIFDDSGIGQKVGVAIKKDDNTIVVYLDKTFVSNKLFIIQRESRFDQSKKEKGEFKNDNRKS